MATLPERLAALDPSSLLVIDEAGPAPVADILDGARRVAAELGPSDGERVAVFASPGREFVQALFGVWHAGGCATVLSPLHPEPESRFFCADGGVRAILVTADLEARAKGFGVERVIPIGAIAASPSMESSRAKADADALMLYTSGTTGKPKGAVLTHLNLGVQTAHLREAWGFSRTDVLLHALPLHHMHGLCIALMTALGAGATTRLLPAWDAPRVWETMREATVFMGVPTMYQRLFVALDQADEETRANWIANAKALRVATSGSAALPVTLAERWRAITGAIPLERFGMTEIGVGLTNPLRPEGRRAGSVGAPLASVEARVVDEHGSVGDQGELQIRGPSVFRGYHGRPESTRDAFVDGWFRTGDTVQRDADGTYRILGRTSVDILKSGGYKLSALEIEEALREHDAVVEVAVIGVPDEAWGERVVACVVTRREIEAESLRDFVKGSLASYKCPKEIVFLSELPKNAMGKVQKPELLSRAKAGWK